MLAERKQDELKGPGGPLGAGDGVWAEARCNDGTGGLVALFYSEQLDDIARAKAICAECPVSERCFEAALARREPYGV